jgi:hypothetical protein
MQGPISPIQKVVNMAIAAEEHETDERHFYVAVAEALQFLSKCVEGTNTAVNAALAQNEALTNEIRHLRQSLQK